MALRIAQHNENLQSLQVEIEQLYEAVKTKTYQAREKLSEYQRLKQLTETTLDCVSNNYTEALALFRQSDRLCEKLQTVKSEHIKLSKVVMNQAQTQPEQARDLISKLKNAREQLRRLYQEIENLRSEGSLV